MRAFPAFSDAVRDGHQYVMSCTFLLYAAANTSARMAECMDVLYSMCSANQGTLCVLAID